MTGPQAIIVRERRPKGPTRRYVYHPLAAGGYERSEELYRAAKNGWHTTGTEVVECLAIDCPGGEL